MEWIMEPLIGFKGIGVVNLEGCQTHYECSCQGGLLVCIVEGALIVKK